MPFFYCTNLYDPLRNSPALPDGIYETILEEARKKWRTDIMLLSKPQEVEIVEQLNQIIVKNDPMIVRIVARHNPESFKGMIFQVHFKDNSDLMTYILKADEKIGFIDAKIVDQMEMFEQSDA